MTSNEPYPSVSPTASEPGVLLISPYPPCRTGPAEYATAFSRALAQRGLRVTVLTEDLPGGRPEATEGVRVRRVWKKDWLLPWRMFFAARRAPGEVIHLNYSFTMYGNSVIGSLTLLTFYVLSRRRPLVVTLFDLLPRRELTRENLALYSVHVPPRLARLAVRLVLKFLAMASERIIVQSPAIRETLLSDYRLAPEKVMVTELPGYAPTAPALGTPDPEPTVRRTPRRTVVFYGFLAPYKGVESLLEAFQRLRDAGGARDLQLIVAGETHPRLTSDYRAELVERARDLGLSSDEVSFPGYLDRRDSEHLFSTADLVVLPYLKTTGSSGTLASAIGFGRPVLVTSLPPLLSQLNGYPAARVVPPGDVAGVAEALAQVEQGRFTPSGAVGPTRRPLTTWYDLVRDTTAAYAAALYRRRTRRFRFPHFGELGYGGEADQVN